MKKILWMLGLLLIPFVPAFADDGYLNIVTGLPESEVYINGKFVAKDFVQNYPLPSGQHYVRITYKEKLMYAKMVTIYSGQVQTITSEHFVDIKTDVPNRGAIERESSRVLETKGGLGLGLIAGYNLPASGLSIKWHFARPFGIHISAFGHSTDNESYSQYGARLLYLVGDKIFGNGALSAYIAAGFSSNTLDDDNDPLDSYQASTAGINIGIEGGPGPIYFSAEVGVAYQDKDYENKSDKSGLQVTGALGMHFFF